MSDSPASKIDLFTVVGARPQFIKSAALTRVLEKEGLTQYLLHSGQHADAEMGLDLLEELGVPGPDIVLSPRQENRSMRMADMLNGVADQIRRVNPAMVVVYGDTDSTLAGALAAHHAGVPLVHIEAGLRSGDRSMPEEHNRIMTDQLSDLLFTTGPEAGSQLIKEGIAADRVVEVGDVMLDLALAVQPLLGNRIPKQWPTAGPILTVTLHRPSTVDQKEVLAGALEAMRTWMESTGGSVYFPVHPRTRYAMDRFGLGLPEGAVDPGPLSYMDMQSALYNASRVLTDSGGVQKEAWYQGTPAVILRDNTEWKALIDMGASALYGPLSILGKGGPSGLADALITDMRPPSVADSDILGGGAAALRIAKFLRQRLS